MKRRINLPIDYKPSENEEYMNAMHREYFLRKLESWKVELCSQSESIVDTLKYTNLQDSDLTDRVKQGKETGLQLISGNRYKKLLNKINEAIERIHNKQYGYCKITGEPIGLKRLMVRPIASLCIEAQQKHDSIFSQSENRSIIV